MKKKNKIFSLMLVFLLILTSAIGCGKSEETEQKEQETQKEPTYTVIEAVDLETVTLGSAQNDAAKISFDSEKWHHWEQMQNLGIALTETWEQEYSVSVVTSVIGEYTEETITDENREDLMEGLGGAGDWITFPVSELRTFEDEVVIYIESTMDYTEDYLKYLVDSQLYTQEWVDQNKETLLNAPNTNQIMIYANVDGHLVSYIGTYYEESQKQVVLDAITIAIQTTDVL